MKKINQIFIAFIVMLISVNAQCPGEYYAFYMAPLSPFVDSLLNKVELSFINESTLPNQEIYIKYRRKHPLGPFSDRIDVKFTALKEQVDVSIDNLDHGKLYELFVCGIFIGDFKDASELLEINMDFEFQKNRLYRLPFVDSDPNSFFPNPSVIGVPRLINLEGLIQEDGNTAIQYFVEDSPRYFFGNILNPIRNKIPFRVQMDLYSKPNCIFNLELRVKCNGYGAPAVIEDIFPANIQKEQWVTSTVDVNFDDVVPWYIWDSIFGYPQFVFYAYTNNLPGDDNYLDNIKIQAIGDRKEICFGESAEIYGALVQDEGIYVDTVLGSSGSIDSLVYTTLIHHPPLFIDRIANGHLRGTGDWLEYRWYDCSTQQLVGMEKDFYPFENGSYYLITSDDICSDTTACMGLNNLSIVESDVDIVQIYPNPVEDNLLIIAEENTISQCLIFDCYGRILMEIRDGEEEKGLSVDCSALPTGSYFIDVTLSNETHLVKKFSKL